jgi:hypothetical protein
VATAEHIGLNQLKQLGMLRFGARPRGLSFLRLLRGLDGWEDKSAGRARVFHRFNGMLVAGVLYGLHQLQYRRVGRCIKYVTTDGKVLSFCPVHAASDTDDREPPGSRCATGPGSP